MALSEQYSCYSIDTSFFNTDEEQALYSKLVKYRGRKKKLKEICERMKTNHSPIRGYAGDPDDTSESAKAVDVKYKQIVKDLDLNQIIKDTKAAYMELIKQHKGMRKLNTKCFDEYHRVNLFASDLSRTCGFKIGEVTEDLIIIVTYFYDITEQNVKNGFYIDNKENRYIYLYSSAGELRKHKTVFIREELYNQHALTLMCGLTVDDINAKGGINPSKYLAYKALSSSATDLWDDDEERCAKLGLHPFDIDKTIVIPDFETEVEGRVDFIDDVKYTIERQNTKLPITHSDGCGMISPDWSDKNFMIRLPFIKGALSSFDFHQYCREKGYSGDIVDIYGKKHNIFDEDIMLIFTESQFKLHKFYDSYEDYKEKFKKYGCHAGVCNMEEFGEHGDEQGKFPRANINYQELQTLIDFTEDELHKITAGSRATLRQISSNKDTMLRVFGATFQNKNKTAYQEALYIYPELLTDAYSKLKLRQVKKSLVKQFRAGKLEISGVYTFIFPDFTACCDHWFGGITEPKGLLQDGEVHCSIYEQVDELDCLRSPHLFCEHAVRKNISNDVTRHYFKTPALYTSIHDYISRILQFDVDGDKSLVIADQALVQLAKRTVEKYDVVSLYYYAKKAEAKEINPDNIYEALSKAFTYSNSIGVYSNNISKIWNHTDWKNISMDEAKEKLNLIQLLCAENNLVIDAAKTLYIPTRPDEVNERIKSAIKCKLPRYFIYAKDKSLSQVSPTTNSFVNSLEREIVEPRLSFKATNLGKLNYHYLMNNEDVVVDPEILKKYEEIGRKFHYRLNIKDDDEGPCNLNAVVENIIKELLAVNPNYSFSEITDMLVKHLYCDKKNATRKEMFWQVCGWEVVKNLMNKVPKDSKQCVICGKRYVPSCNHQKYCPACAADAYKDHRAEWSKGRREKQRAFLEDVQRREAELVKREQELEAKIKEFEAERAAINA